MNAKEFNDIWHRIAQKELLPAGFIRNGNSYLSISGTTIFQFSKNSHKTNFTGFLYGYTHTFLESWTDEFPTKWPLNIEQLMLAFSKDSLNQCANVGLKKGSVLALTYSNGNRNLHTDFPIIMFDQWNETEAETYISECVNSAKTSGLKILKELNPTISIELLEGKVEDSFMPARWLRALKENGA